MATAAGIKRRLTIQTLNVCFEAPYTFSTRFDYIAQAVLQKQPSIVCLQEVTSELYLELERRVSKQYAISPPPHVFAKNATPDPYFTLILCRKELGPKFTRHPYRNTGMMRDLLVATFDEADLQSLAVGTTHLESLDHHAVRETQMLECHQILARHRNAIITGDFNFCSFENYHRNRNANDALLPLQNDSLAVCLPGYVDVWPALHPRQDEGYTFDTARNQWKTDRELNPRYDRKFRFDRILARLEEGGGFAIQDMRIVYNEPIARLGGPIPCMLYVSDHMGLECALIVKQQQQEQSKRARLTEVITLEESEEEEDVQGEVCIRLILMNGTRVERKFPASSHGKSCEQLLRDWARSVDPGLSPNFQIVHAATRKPITAADNDLQALHQCTLRVKLIPIT